MSKVTLILNYTVQSHVLIGDTKPVKDILKEGGACFNPRLVCGAGWRFSVKSDIEPLVSKLRAAGVDVTRENGTRRLGRSVIRPTYYTMIVKAILSEGRNKAFSRHAIAKYIRANWTVSNAFKAHLRSQINILITNGKLVTSKSGCKFKLSSATLMACRKDGYY